MSHKIVWNISDEEEKIFNINNRAQHYQTFLLCNVNFGSINLDGIHNTLFSSYLINGPNKLECLFLTGYSRPDKCLCMR
jgi:hypothetical protein